MAILRTVIRYGLVETHIGIKMATDWWWIVPVSEINAGTRPSDAVLYSVASGQPNDQLLLNGGSILYKNANYVRFQGPFTSQSAAQSATANPGTSLSPGQAIGTIGNGLSTGVSGGAGIATGIGAFSGFAGIDDFLNALSQSNTWLRIAEGILGVMLIAVALGKLTGANNVITKAVAKIP